MAEATSSLDLRQGLSATIAALGLEPNREAIARLEAFVALLLRWNRTYNLTGARDEQVLVRDHLIDCLAIIPVLEARIDSDSRQGQVPLMIDVGSGAGFPGLVIAAMRPQWPVALIEPSTKKSAFLQQAIAALRLSNVRAINRRLENAEPELEHFGADPAPAARHFTCRAVSSLPALVELVRPHARAGSRLFAMKSRRAEPIPGEQVSIHCLRLPDSDKHRTLIEVLLAAPDDGVVASATRSR
jgi:16S rRNA (guanine527-N7)-methyltransferase